MEADDKVLSIPFKDVCLTSDTIQETGIKSGSVIQWKENGTRWIVYSQYLQEIAYFRGQMRQCASDPIEIEGKQFWYYLKGPDEKGIDWQKTKHFIFNDLNYTVEIYISNVSETKQFFQRFAKCKIHGRNFEVQAVDDLSTEGILCVYLKEDYTNPWEEQSQIVVVEPDFNTNSSAAQIIGPKQVHPFDIVEYSIKNASDGEWLLNNRRAQIVSQSDSKVKIEITTGKSGDVNLIYRVGGVDIVVFNITILSL